jgi:hypothetical protein
VTVYCREHGGLLGVVRLAPGGFPMFETRHPRWRNRLADKVGLSGRANEFYNLRDWTRPEVPARECRDCPDSRTVEVAVLLDAYDRGLPKISL